MMEHATQFPEAYSKVASVQKKVRVFGVRVACGRQQQGGPEAARAKSSTRVHPLLASRAEGRGCVDHVCRNTNNRPSNPG
jgi:hypothetical protein